VEVHVEQSRFASRTFTRDGLAACNGVILVTECANC
jgi:hypothetical protein